MVQTVDGFVVPYCTVCSPWERVGITCLGAAAVLQLSALPLCRLRGVHPQRLPKAVVQQRRS